MSVPAEMLGLSLKLVPGLSQSFRQERRLCEFRIMIVEVGCWGHRGQAVYRSGRKFGTACSYDNVWYDL